MNNDSDVMDTITGSATRPCGAATSESNNTSLDTLPTDEFLRVIGTRVRAQRSSMSMSRKRLAEVSGVSERYLAQLESGQGNMSIALLRKVTSAIGMSLGALLSAQMPESEQQPKLNGAGSTPNVAHGVGRVHNHSEHGTHSIA